MTETTNTAPTNLLWGTAYEAREGIYAALDVVLQKWADKPETKNLSHVQALTGLHGIALEESRIFLNVSKDNNQFNTSKPLYSVVAINKGFFNQLEILDAGTIKRRHNKKGPKLIKLVTDYLSDLGIVMGDDPPKSVCISIAEKWNPTVL